MNHPVVNVSPFYIMWSVFMCTQGNEPMAASNILKTVLKTQLDIIYVLGCSKVPLLNQGDEENPSQMALDCGFHEASILLGKQCV